LEVAGGNHHTVRALREFLVGMLAAIVTTKTYLPLSEQLAAEDAAQLNALVRKINEIAPHQRPPPASAPTTVEAELRLLPGIGTAQPPPQLLVDLAAERSRKMVPLAQRGARAAVGAAGPHEVIPFRNAARQPQPAMEASSATGPEFRSHVASLYASRSAIARKKELTAQKREVFARSHALLTKSRSLKTSLEGMQLGRHF
jgi:hypothetical protein